MTSSNQFDLVKGSAKFDLVVAGKTKLPPGSSDWKTYTPTPSTGAFGGSNVLFRYRITGTTLQIIGQFTSVSGTAGSGNYSFSLPTGCVAGRATHPACGSGYIQGGTNTYAAIIEMTNTATFLFRLIPVTSVTNTLPVWGSSSAADVVLDSALVFGGMNATIELSPTCAAVVSNA